MSVEVHVQRASTLRGLPSNRQMSAWLAQALAPLRPEASLTVRIVDAEEGSALNAQWRGKQGPTNVLSFPVSGLEAIAPTLLGDIVLCAPVLKAEAAAQRKPSPPIVRICWCMALCICWATITWTMPRPRRWKRWNASCSPIWNFPTLTRSVSLSHDR